MDDVGKARPRLTKLADGLWLNIHAVYSVSLVDKSRKRKRWFQPSETIESWEVHVSRREDGVELVTVWEWPDGIARKDALECADQIANAVNGKASSSTDLGREE